MPPALDPKCTKSAFEKVIEASATAAATLAALNATVSVPNVMTNQGQQQIAVQNQIAQNAQQAELDKQASGKARVSLLVRDSTNGQRVIDRMPFNYHYGSSAIQVFEKNLSDIWYHGQYPGVKQQADFGKTKGLYPYGHAMLRTLSDYMFARSLTYAKDKHVIDIGSKYHKVLSWKDAIGYKSLSAVRPELFNYDKCYNQQHEHLIDGKDNFLFKCELKDMKLEGIPTDQVIITANDCLWYDGVLDQLGQKSIQGFSVFASLCIYTNKEGKYEYPDAEGHFEVVEKDGFSWIVNKPHDNDSQGGYQHFNLNIPYERGQPCFVPAGETRAVYMREVCSIEIIPGACRQVLYAFDASKDYVANFSNINRQPILLKEKISEEIVTADFGKFTDVYRNSALQNRHYVYMKSNCKTVTVTATPEEYELTMRVLASSAVDAVKQPKFVAALAKRFVQHLKYAPDVAENRAADNILVYTVRRNRSKLQHYAALVSDPLLKVGEQFQNLFVKRKLRIKPSFWNATLHNLLIGFAPIVWDTLVFLNDAMVQTGTVLQQMRDLWNFSILGDFIKLRSIQFGLNEYVLVCLILYKTFGLHRDRNVDYIVGSTSRWARALLQIKLLGLDFSIIFARYLIQVIFFHLAIEKTWALAYFTNFVLGWIVSEIFFALFQREIEIQVPISISEKMDAFEQNRLNAQILNELLEEISITHPNLKNIVAAAYDKRDVYACMVKDLVSDVKRRVSPAPTLSGGDDTLKSREDDIAEFVYKFHKNEHIDRATAKKLDHKNWGNVKDLKFYKLEHGDYHTMGNKIVTTQEELKLTSGIEIRKYYQQFCTCSKSHTNTYAPQPKDAITGTKMVSYTFSTCPVNSVAALIARHLYTDQSPNLLMQREFSLMCEPIMKELAKRVLERTKHEHYDIDEHLNHYPQTVRQMLKDAAFDLLFCKPVVRLLKCFVKTGEFQYITEEDKQANKLEGRPRQIWGPSPTLKLWCGWYNRMMLKAVKKIVPGVICGYSNTKLANKVKKDTERLIKAHGADNVKTFVFDGTSHDSHQNVHLIRAVDVNFINATAPTIFERYGILKDIADQSIEAMTADVNTGYCTTKVGETERLIYTIDIQGTVYSGHPTRTTLGNSLRTLLYICYAVYLAFGFQEAFDVFFGTSKFLVVYVAGDDVQIKGRSDYVERVIENIGKTHSKSTTVGPYGLGQTARVDTMIVGNWEFFDFLSKDGYCFHDFIVTRKPERVLNKQNHTYGNKEPLDDKQKRKFVQEEIVSLNVAVAQAENSWAQGLLLFDNWVRQRMRLAKLQLEQIISGVSDNTKRQIAQNKDAAIERMTTRHRDVGYRMQHHENPVDHANDYWEQHICDTFGYSMGQIVNYVEAQLEGEVIYFAPDG